jgi:membrane associated rhomboid family serine protease
MEELEAWKDKSSQAWIDFCDQVEAKGGPTGEFVSRNILKRIVVNAPVLLSFVLLCTILHACSVLYPGLRPILGVDDRFTELWNPLSYLSLFTHVLAHENWAHLQGNMVHLLLVGPAVEHAFGSKNLFYIIVVVAFSSALVHLAIGKQFTYQLGASGVVFACIMLSSLVTASTGTLPLSFVIVATWWLGDEVWKFFVSGDTVSHHAHLSGGGVGTMAGYYIHQKRAEETAKGIASKWLSGFRSTKKKR